MDHKWLKNYNKIKVHQGRRQMLNTVDRYAYTDTEWDDVQVNDDDGTGWKSEDDYPDCEELRGPRRMRRGIRGNTGRGTNSRGRGQQHQSQPPVPTTRTTTVTTNSSSTPSRANVTTSTATTTTSTPTTSSPWFPVFDMSRRTRTPPPVPPAKKKGRAGYWVTVAAKAQWVPLRYKNVRGPGYTTDKNKIFAPGVHTEKDPEPKKRKKNEGPVKSRVPQNKNTDDYEKKTNRPGTNQPPPPPPIIHVTGKDKYQKTVQVTATTAQPSTSTTTTTSADGMSAAVASTSRAAAVASTSGTQRTLPRRTVFQLTPGAKVRTWPLPNDIIHNVRDITTGYGVPFFQEVRNAPLVDLTIALQPNTWTDEVRCQLFMRRDGETGTVTWRRYFPRACIFWSMYIYSLNVGDVLLARRLLYLIDRERRYVADMRHSLRNKRASVSNYFATEGGLDLNNPRNLELVRSNFLVLGEYTDYLHFLFQYISVQLPSDEGSVEPVQAQPSQRHRSPAQSSPRSESEVESSEVQGSQFQGRKIQSSQAQGRQFQRSQARGSQFPGSQFPGSQFPGSQFPGSQFPGSQFPGSQLPGSQLHLSEDDAGPSTKRTNDEKESETVEQELRRLKNAILTPRRVSVTPFMNSDVPTNMTVGGNMWGLDELYYDFALVDEGHTVDGSFRMAWDRMFNRSRRLRLLLQGAYHYPGPHDVYNVIRNLDYERRFVMMIRRLERVTYPAVYFFGTALGNVPTLESIDRSYRISLFWAYGEYIEFLDRLILQHLMVARNRVDPDTGTRVEYVPYGRGGPEVDTVPPYRSTIRPLHWDLRQAPAVDQENDQRPDVDELEQEERNDGRENNSNANPKQ